MRRFWRSLRLWFATLPSIHWKRSRIKHVCIDEQIGRAVQAQAELNQQIDQIIDEAFEIALQNNRDSWALRGSDGLPPRPKRGDITYAW